MCKCLHCIYIQCLIFDSSSLTTNIDCFHHSAMPLVILLVVNIGILISWTLVDPLVYKRFEIDGAPWSTYARCVGSSKASDFFLIALGVLNAVVLLLALFQAWKARNISDEFSETKIVGSAVSHSSWPHFALVNALITYSCHSQTLHSCTDGCSY